MADDLDHEDEIAEALFEANRTRSDKGVERVIKWVARFILKTLRRMAKGDRGLQQEVEDISQEVWLAIQRLYIAHDSVETWTDKTHVIPYIVGKCGWGLIDAAQRRKRNPGPLPADISAPNRSGHCSSHGEAAERLAKIRARCANCFGEKWTFMYFLHKSDPKTYTQTLLAVIFNECRQTIVAKFAEITEWIRGNFGEE